MSLYDFKKLPHCIKGLINWSNNFVLETNAEKGLNYTYMGGWGWVGMVGVWGWVWPNYVIIMLISV